MTDAPKKLLCIKEVCAEFGLKPTFVRRMVKAKKFPHLRPGHRTLYFERDQVVEWIAEQRVVARHA